MRRNSPFVVALLSLSLLALEFAWTRLFSAEFFYTYAFLALSLAVLGMGFGALAVRLFPRLGGENLLGPWLTITGLTALAGPPLVFRLGLDFARLFGSVAMVGRFVLVLLCLGLPFFFGGMALVGIFKRAHDQLPRLYAADLLGAGLGVVLALVMMNALGTPVAVVWLALPVLVAAVLTSRRGWRLLPLVVLAAMAVLTPRARTLLASHREERAPVIYEHWDAMAKVKQYDFGDHRGLNIDNVANSPVYAFDGNWDALRKGLEPDGWDIDVGYLVDQFERCRFLVLGSGGGSDVLQALEQGATEVHAVEVNPHINRMMQEGDPGGYIVRDSSTVDSTGAIVTCARFSGFLYRDPRVRVVSEDARTYVRRHPNSFDVIFSISSNTWAALGSGSFALAESYLFTTEAFQDYWRALSPGGFLSMEHQVYMPRLVAEVIDALTALGVQNPRDHFAVYDLPKLRRNVLLLSKRPLTDEIRSHAYKAMADGRYDFMRPLVPAPDSLRNRLVNRVATLGWRAAADSARINVSPCSDDRPFVAQLGRWKNLDRTKLAKLSTYAEFQGFPVSKLILLVILGVVLVLALPVLFVPYRARSRSRGQDPAAPVQPPATLPFAAWLYFFAIGIAFMAVEVVLIQKYTLFLGASAYSTPTILLVLLVAAGVGSRVADRIRPRMVFAWIASWLLLEAFALRGLTNALAALPLPARTLVTVVLVFPLGFFMGMPFPKGAKRVGELVDWGFAVNGVASVLGGTLVLLVALTWGFTSSLVVMAAVYLAAGLLFTRAWAR